MILFPLDIYLSPDIIFIMMQKVIHHSCVIMIRTPRRVFATVQIFH